MSVNNASVTQTTAAAIPNNTYVKALLNAGNWHWDQSKTGGAVHWFVDPAGWSTAQYNSMHQAVADALAAWGSVCNIKFVEASSWLNAEIVVNQTTSTNIFNFGGYSGQPKDLAEASGQDLAAIRAGTATLPDVISLTSGDKLNVYKDDVTTTDGGLVVAHQGQADVYVATDGAEGAPGSLVNIFNADGSISAHGYHLIVHELGHSLGLDHPHSKLSTTNVVFPGVTGAQSAGDHGLNATIYSVMSYQHTGPLGAGITDTVDGPMAFDIAAMQTLYGVNTTYHAGNDQYLLSDPGQSKAWHCIWDAGGVDRIDYLGSANAVIDLRAATLDDTVTGGGRLSYTWKDTPTGRIYGDGFTIAHGVVIENARGGSGDDTITGNSSANCIDGGGGTNTLTGGGGRDTFHFGNDWKYDTITDFAAGDILDLRDVTGLSSLSQLHPTLDPRGNMHLTFNGDVITLEGVHAVNASMFEFDHVPVINAPHSITVDVNKTVAIGRLFNAHDADGNETITEYQLMDTGAGGGHLTVDRHYTSPADQAEVNMLLHVPHKSSPPAFQNLPKGQWITVDAADIGSIHYVGGSGGDTLSARAFDGTNWSATASVAVTAPVKHPPIVTAHDATVGVNAAVSMSSLFTAHDPDGLAITAYEFMDLGTGGGHLSVNGNAMAANTWIKVTAADLGKVSYVGGHAAGSETLEVAAYDGREWSATASLTARTIAPDTPPVVTTHDTSLITNAAVSMSSLFTAHDADGDAITKYMFRDDGDVGHLRVNGVTMASHTWITVDASQLASASYVGGSHPGIDTLHIQAFDGHAWSADASLLAKTNAPPPPPPPHVPPGEGPPHLPHEITSLHQVAHSHFLM